MSHFTPGNWVAVGKAVHSESGREIIFRAHNTQSGTDAEQRANAQLISAAPEMLAILHRILDAGEGRSSDWSLDMVRDAVDKAEGRTA